MVVLAVELGQFAPEVGAHRPHDLLHPRQVPVAEYLVPVLRDENHMGVQDETSAENPCLPVRDVTDSAMKADMLRCAASVQLPALPGAGPACCVGAGVRVCAGGVQRRAAGTAAGARGGVAVCVGRGAVDAADRGQVHAGAGVVGRGVGGGAAAGSGRPEHRLPQLFHLDVGQAQGPRVGPPRLRSRKDHRQAIRFTTNARFKVLDSGRLRLPKIGDVEVRWSRDLPADPSSVTVVRDAAGRYFASFVVQPTRDAPLPATDSDVGIDLGLTLRGPVRRYEGHRAEVPAPGGSKLRRLQQDVPQDQGQQAQEEAAVKLARAHARVADTGRDWQHKLST